MFYNKNFNQQLTILIGQISSNYSNDLKPVKHWKIISAIRSTIEGPNVALFTRPLKSKNRRWKSTRRKLRLYLNNFFLKNQRNIVSFNKKQLEDKPLFKVFSKRVQAPNYVVRWKTSYPLMFTNNNVKNKLNRNQLDLSLTYFLKSRFFRRTRRGTRTLFRRLKRINFRRTQVKSSTAPKTLNMLSAKKQLSHRATLRSGYHLLRYINKAKTPKISKLFKQSRRLKLHFLKTYVDLVPSPKEYSTNIGRARRTTNMLNAFRFYSFGIKKLRTNNLSNLTKISFKKTHGPSLTTNTFMTEQVFELNPTLQTRTKKNFTFKNLGMFLNALTFFNQKNPFTYKFLFKKKIFSFLFPNEVRNSIMNRKKRITFYRLVYKFKTKMKNKPRYAISSFNKFFLKQYKYSLISKTNQVSTNSIFAKNNYKQNSSTMKYSNYVTSRDEILYTENFTYRGQDTSFRWSEVKIPRVRFKPGYQRMWRRARTALKESLGLKFVYQKQLTRYLTRFYKGSNRYTFSRAEMSLNRVIMYSRLLPDNPTVDTFLIQKIIYLNGRVVHDPNTILVPNDIVQLIVSLWYYVTYRWIANWTLKRGKKFKKLVYRKGLAGRQKVMKLKKQRSYYTPNWVYLTRYDISDVKPYLEVDYFTLSTIVLYEPFMTYYFSPDETPDFRPTIYRMYNWKYIT